MASLTLILLRETLTMYAWKSQSAQLEKSSGNPLGKSLGELSIHSIPEDKNIIQEHEEQSRLLPINLNLPDKLLEYQIKNCANQ